MSHETNDTALSASEERDRLQLLVAELLIKNERLRNQLHGCTANLANCLETEGKR